ncbi:MAG: aminotransferase class V-fold PLP-dependent enzyme, partial [Oscillospiraceae bacterium]|nr:aminotransferase class V-fold PLP-dependent enzyme [Oscillospiraceae bacterium]
MSRLVYADNAATTKLSETALTAMLPWLRDGYGNPSSVYRLGREARRAVDGARDQVASALGAKAEEIIFTGSATEGVNWALRGAARQFGEKGRHIITSAVEHSAVG